MPDPANPQNPPASTDVPPEDFGYPRGTLAIVAIFGALLLLGWLAMYVYIFLARGAMHP